MSSIKHSVQIRALEEEVKLLRTMIEHQDTRLIEVESFEARLAELEKKRPRGRPKGS